MGHPEFPSDETLAAFIDGQADAETRKRVIEHMVGCNDCYATFEAASEMRERSEARAVVPFPKKRMAVIGFAAAAAAAVVAVIAIPSWNRSRDPLRQLQFSRRTTESRLTLLPYAPYRPTRGGTAEENYSALSVAAKLQEKASSERTADNLHRLGVAQLAVGRIEAANQTLAEAAKLDHSSTAILSDLAAAELAASNAADAAENAANALALDRTFAPAAFNSALAMERLSNRPAAIRAWESYLRLDATTPWANEAREHLQRLQQNRSSWERDKLQLLSGVSGAALRGIVERYPQRARSSVQDDLLPAWLRHGNTDALALARAIAEARAAAGDPFLLDVVTHAARRSPGMIAAIETFAQARGTAKAHDADAAAREFTAASDLLERAGSPLMLASMVYGATNSFYAGKYDAALSTLDAVDRQLHERNNRYPSIAAESKWVEGLVLARIGHPAQSFESYKTGVALARKAHDVEDEVAISALVAGELERVGERSDADALRDIVLRRLDETAASDQRMYNAYSQSAQGALAAGRPYVALAFIEAQWDIARQQKDPLLIAESECERAQALRDLGDMEGAMRNLAAARAPAASVKTEALRDRITSDIDFVAGAIRSSSDAHSAAASFTSAIQVWQRHGWRIRTAAGLLARGETELAARDRQSAEADFRAGIQQIEQERTGFDEPPLRVAHFEHASLLFDRLTELLIADNRTTEALSVTDRKRGREVLERTSQRGEATPAFPRDAKLLAASLPTTHVVLEFAVLSQGTATWLVQRNRISVLRSNASRTEIEETVNRYVRAILKDDRDNARRDGRWLFDRLVGPLEAQIAPASIVAVVPEGVLYRIPFAALVEPDGSYWIEHHAIEITPSASSLVVHRSAKARRTSILAVAEPAPQSQAALENAAAETEQIARLYAHAALYEGAQLGPKEFLSKARTAAVIHFAGHTDKSALLFESPQEDHLTADAIAATDLPLKPVVVLAACDTAAGRIRANEGTDDLAIAFVKAGAEAVVATLWDLDDKASAHLFRVFHERLQRGENPVEALREVQRGCISSTDRSERKLSAWAGLVVVGTS